VAESLELADSTRLREESFELGALDAAEGALGAEPVKQRDFQLTGGQDLTVVGE